MRVETKEGRKARPDPVPDMTPFLPTRRGAVFSGVAWALAFLLTFGSVKETRAQTAIDLQAVCRGKYGTACFAYAINGHVELRKEPNVSAPAIQSVPFARMVLLLDPFEIREGWLQAQALTENETVARVAWVRRSDVALAWDFHRVVNCWPVSRLTWTEEEAGDDPRRVFDVRSNTRGSVNAKVSAGLGDFRNLAIWYARGIFRIAKIGRPQEALAATFILDYPAREVQLKLDIIGEVGDPPFRLAAEKSLSECTAIPTVDLKQTMAQPPKQR